MCFRLTLTLLLATATLSAQGPDRSRPPAVGPAPALNLPQIQKRQLSNGLPIWIVELRDVPVVQVSLVIGSGTADDPAGKYGVASLTAAMLLEGAGPRSALDIADAVDFLGADLSATSTFDSSVIRLHVPIARLAEALPIMADSALRPTFPDAEIDRLRQQRLTTLLQARDDAAAIASLALSRVIYGTAHRFGTAAMGTAETIKTLRTDDLRAFYTTVYRPDNATLLVVGDISPERVVPLAEASFGEWRATGLPPTRVKHPAVPVRERREVYLVDKPSAPQTQIRIGTVGAARSTQDYFPILVMNTILGGSFSSRLNMNLRERNGYSYGASSGFDMRVEPGPFAAAAGVQTDKTAEALKEFFNELNGILQPVPANELSRAKGYVALRFPAGFETTADISRRLEEALVHRLPDDYFSRYVRSIDAITPVDVQRAARTYIKPDTLAVVVVGDRQKIGPGIQALNLGPIRHLTLDELFGAAN